jgi:hypothetical protein
LGRERAGLLPHAGKLHFTWRVHDGVEFRTRGGRLAAGLNEFCKQTLPDAVKPSDFRRICLSPRGRSGLKAGAHGSDLSAETNELLKLVGSNAIKPFDFCAGSRRFSARFQKAL